MKSKSFRESQYSIGKCAIMCNKREDARKVWAEMTRGNTFKTEFRWERGCPTNIYLVGSGAWCGEAYCKEMGIKVIDYQDFAWDWEEPPQNEYQPLFEYEMFCSPWPVMYAVHCPDEESAQKVFKYLRESAGTMADSFCEELDWEKFEQRTCIVVRSATVRSLSYCRTMKIKVLEYSDFSWPWKQASSKTMDEIVEEYTQKCLLALSENIKESVNSVIEECKRLREENEKLKKQIEKEKQSPNLPKFNLDNYCGKYAMHCPERWQANEFSRFLADQCRTWCDGASYLKRSVWYKYQRKTCYCFNVGSYSDVGFAESLGYEILEFSDFSWD